MKKGEKSIVVINDEIRVYEANEDSELPFYRIMEKVKSKARENCSFDGCFISQIPAECWSAAGLKLVNTETISSFLDDSFVLPAMAENLRIDVPRCSNCIHNCDSRCSEFDCDIDNDEAQEDCNHFCVEGDCSTLAYDEEEITTVVFGNKRCTALEAFQALRPFSENIKRFLESNPNVENDKLHFV